MKPARENSERPAAVGDAGTAVAADTVVAGTVASEEATDELANRDFCERRLGRAGFEPAKA